MSSRKSFVVVLIVFIPSIASATVDFLAVNKFTKEYYWGDGDRSPGWIGWAYVPEAQLDTAEDDLKRLGYTETFYPFKIETYMAGYMLICTVGIYIIRRNVSLRSNSNISG